MSLKLLKVKIFEHTNILVEIVINTDGPEFDPTPRLYLRRGFVGGRAEADRITRQSLSMQSCFPSEHLFR